MPCHHPPCQGVNHPVLCNMGVVHGSVASRLCGRRLVTASRADLSWSAQRHLCEADFPVQRCNLPPDVMISFRVMRMYFDPSSSPSMC